jgi:hypothetical protein
MTAPSVFSRQIIESLVMGRFDFRAWRLVKTLQLNEALMMVKKISVNFERRKNLLPSVPFNIH